MYAETVEGTEGPAVAPNNSHFDPGPAPPGSAIAEYNIVTGEFIISANELLAWWLESTGKLAGPDLEDVRDVLPAGHPDNLSTAGPSVIMEANIFGEHFSYTNVNLGRVANPGVDAAEFRLRYTAELGGGSHPGQILVVPEPGAVWMVVIGGLVLLVLCPRWAAVRRPIRQGD